MEESVTAVPRDQMHVEMELRLIRSRTIVVDEVDSEWF
tara:strand:+ start:68663 stop:68776 length:114 start_codon:yes stop_codon:yes gene_type:complete